MKKPTSTNLPELLTLVQVAELLQVCVRTVRRLIDKHNIPISRVGQQIRISADHVPLFTRKDW